MSLVRSLLLTGLLLMSSSHASAAPSPVRLRCQIDRSDGPAIIQFYQLDRAAGTVLAEPNSLYTAAGAPRDGEKIASVSYIDRWTDDQLALRTEYRSKDLPYVATITDLFDLRTLIQTGEYRWSGPVRSDQLATGPNACKRVPFETPGR